MLAALAGGPELAGVGEGDGPPLLPEREPTDAELIYYNARLALRDDAADEAVKLWLLRNAHNDLTDKVSRFDEDFRSVSWVAMGELGLCQDGQDFDDVGAGLWPLAMHNWVAKNRNRRGGGNLRRSFSAFDVDQQQRPITIDDVLDHQELRTVRFVRGRCVRPHLAMVAAGAPITGSLRDRRTAANTLVHLLERSKVTLRDDRVRGQAAIEARLFDLRLQLVGLNAQAARRRASRLASLARMFGLSRPAVGTIKSDADPYDFPADSEEARILRESATWPTSEWMALSPERRIFLFDHASTYLGDDVDMDPVALGILDALIARGDGAEASRWIPRVGEGTEAERLVWSGERGERILALDDDSGFGERGVVALHRGVDALQRGELERALRAFAYAVQHAPESAASDAVHGLGLRWVSYVAAQFELTDALLVTLQELLPRRAYGQILEDLMWSAAFRADEASFGRGMGNQIGRGALTRRLALLVPLASGDTRAFSAGIGTGLEESPSETMRFLDQLVQRLELEEPDVRSAQRPTLLEVRARLEPLSDPTSRSRQGRQASALQQRTLALLEGMGGVGDDGSLRDDARRIAPGAEVFAGSVRLAPSDPLPWPFRPISVSAPSPFEPLELTPVEWKDADGRWVLGWSIGG